jgi:hypothetical protein
MKDWIEKHFSEQWTDVENCLIDFTKYKPISTSDSLHIYEERYKIENKEYRLLYIISDLQSKPLIQTLTYS